MSSAERVPDEGADPSQALPDGSLGDAGLTEEAALEVLTRGEISVTGRLTDASNVTVLAEATLDGVGLRCIYKPVRGERPLWDFPDGTLAGREYAAYRISEYAGWRCVPMTVLRDGPFGTGMVQRWIDDAEPDDMVDLLPLKRIPTGWLRILRALDEDGDQVAVAHADDPRLALLAGFDIVVNNADRKGSHVLPTPDGRVLGVDHGICFHVEDKLRTVLWGFAGRPLSAELVAGVDRLRRGWDADLAPELAPLFTRAETRALLHRLDVLAATPEYPRPPSRRTPIPWPPL